MDPADGQPGWTRTKEAPLARPKGEAAIVDHSWTSIRSLEGTDSRVLDFKVAGPAALLVAKLHKLAERQSTPSRQDDKDALDVYRLMRSIPSRQLGVDLPKLLVSAVASEGTRAALIYLADLFGGREGAGSIMTARSLEGLDDPRRVATECSLLASEVLSCLPSEGSA